jgi:hypothetical protein
MNSSKVNSWTGTGDNPDPAYGATLHDDHVENEENKDVYVENWGQNPIIVRLTLSEYMEIGQGAGTKNAPDLNQAQSIDTAHPDANIDDPASWTIHAVNSDDTDPANSAGDVFHTYWEWVMGGQKYYNPAPADKRGQPDANGIDYVDSLSPETIDASTLGVNQTLNADKIITIDEWDSLPLDEQIGNYWVLDTDGFWYWAAPLGSKQSTGLLLDKVVLKNKPSQDYYYGINVQAQMASLDVNIEGQSAASPPVLDNYEVLLQNATEKGKALINRILSAANEFPAQIENPTPSPEPEPSSEPTPSLESEPTATPTPVPEATATPTATPSPEPTATPSPEPTATPTSTPSPEPTATPTPTPEPPPAVTRTVTVNLFRPLEGEMSLSLTNVVNFDDGVINATNATLKESEIENGGKILASAPCTVTYLNPIEGVIFPPFILKLNLTQEEFDEYSEARLSADELSALIPEWKNPDDAFEWSYSPNTGASVTLDKGFYIVGYFTTVSGDVNDLLDENNQITFDNLTSKFGYIQVK